MIADFKTYAAYEAAIVRESEKLPNDFATFPHCDHLVLHAPGECAYCDEYPNYQRVRRTFQIAFTNQEPAGNEFTCPAEVRRPRKIVNAWGGNIPRPPEKVLPITPTVPARRCGERRKLGWYCMRELGHEGPCAATNVKIIDPVGALNLDDPKLRAQFEEAINAVALRSVRGQSDEIRWARLRAAIERAADRGPESAGGVYAGRGAGRGPGTGALLWAALVKLERPGRRLGFVFAVIVAALTLLFGWNVAALPTAALAAFTVVGGYYLMGGKDE